MKYTEKESDFCDWLINEKGLSIPTSRDYCNLLVKVDSLAHNKKILTEHLSEQSNSKKIGSLVDNLVNSQEFFRFNKEKFGRPLRMLNYYVEYCGGKKYIPGNCLTATHKADDKYKSWLINEKNLTDHTASNYCCIIGYCDDFAHTNNLYSENITDINNPDKVSSLVDVLMNSDSFTIFNKEKHGTPFRALNYYVEYCGGKKYIPGNCLMATHKADDKYKNWLINEKNLTVHTASNYCCIIGYCDDFAHTNNLYSENITDINNPDKVSSLVDILINSDLFAIFNKEKYGTPFRALNYYVEYFSGNGSMSTYTTNVNGNFKTSITFKPFLELIKMKCESNISLMTERGKSAIEIPDLDEAVLQFTACHEKIKDAKEAIIFSSNIVEKILSNEYLYSKLLSFEIKSIDDFIEKLELIIKKEKRNANAVIDDDWDEAERVMNNARSNIKEIKQIITDLDDLKQKIDVT